MVVAGWVTSDLASPRLFEMSTQAQRVQQRERRVLAAVHLERHDGAAAAVICRSGELVLRVASRNG